MRHCAGRWAASAGGRCPGAPRDDRARRGQKQLRSRTARPMGGRPPVTGGGGGGGGVAGVEQRRRASLGWSTCNRTLYVSVCAESVAPGARWRSSAARGVRPRGCRGAHPTATAMRVRHRRVVEEDAHLLVGAALVAGVLHLGLLARGRARTCSCPSRSRRPSPRSGGCQRALRPPLPPLMAKPPSSSYLRRCGGRARGEGGGLCAHARARAGGGGGGGGGGLARARASAAAAA